MRILLDEMWSPKIAIRLRDLGHDVIAAAERIDLRTKPDVVIFVFAQHDGRCVLTDNVGDFQHQAMLANARGESHHGLIFASSRRYSRHNPRNTGLIVVALTGLLTSDLDLTNQEHWFK